VADRACGRAVNAVVIRRGLGVGLAYVVEGSRDWCTVFTKETACRRGGRRGMGRKRVCNFGVSLA
jgi:hypothetical protein